jgi:hypothetical protein
MSGIDWFKPIDAYCERVGPEFWAEPFNAISNIFLFLSGLAGFYLISKMKRRSPEPFSVNWLYALSFAACLVGVGSFFFHTYANFLTLWGDIIPIMIFMEIFLAFALREIFGWKWTSTGVGLVVFFVIGLALQLSLPKNLLNGSVTYIHGVLLLLIMVFALAKPQPELARKFSLCLRVFLLSLVFRTFDFAVCDQFAHGTHFIWHTLNGLLLFLIIRIAFFTYSIKAVR